LRYAQTGSDIYVNNKKSTKLLKGLYDLLSRNQQFESHKPQGHRRVIWSLTSGPVELLKTYIVVNFKTNRISWGTRKLPRIPTLIKKKNTKLLKVSNFFEDPRCSTIEIKTCMNLFIINLYSQALKLACVGEQGHQWRILFSIALFHVQVRRDTQLPWCFRSILEVGHDH
jgi:hypothetical protein